MVYKYMIYHGVLFTKKSYLENKRPKSANKRELLANRADKKKSIRKPLKE